MKNKEKQIKEEPKNSKQAESLSETELDKIAGGRVNSELENVAVDKATPKLFPNS